MPSGIPLVIAVVSALIWGQGRTDCHRLTYTKAKSLSSKMRAKPPS